MTEAEMKEKQYDYNMITQMLKQNGITQVNNYPVKVQSGQYHAAVFAAS